MIFDKSFIILLFLLQLDNAFAEFSLQNCIFLQDENVFCVHMVKNRGRTSEYSNAKVHLTFSLFSATIFLRAGWAAAVRREPR